jgi:hypothetical protein
MNNFEPIGEEEEVTSQKSSKKKKKIEVIPVSEEVLLPLEKEKPNLKVPSMELKNVRKMYKKSS